MASKWEAIDALDKAVKTARPRIRRLFEDAMRILGEDFKRENIDQAIETGLEGPLIASTAFAAFRAHLLEIFGADGPIAATLNRAVRLALDEPPIRGLELDLPRLDTAVREWLDQEGARFVTRISERTRKAIRVIIQDAFRGSPSTLKQSARAIAKLRGFGLTVQQSRSLLKYGEGLSVRVGLREISATQRKAMIKARYGKLLRRRAMTVARTESYTAGNAARRIVWREAVRQKQISAEDYVLEWVTRVIRVCPRCQALNGKTAEIEDGVFVSDPVASGSFRGQVIRVERPTVHPDCFCGLRTRRRGDVPAPPVDSAP